MDILDELKYLKGETLRTLDRGNRFDVLDVNTMGVIIKPLSTRKERLIPKKGPDGAFRELVAIGQITRTQIEEKHSPRNPVYVTALLAELPGVRYSIRPIDLRYQR